MRILLTTAMLLLLPVQLSFADATITTTFTSAQVATVAGSDSDIGNQLPPENGVIKNSVFSEVVQDPNTGNGAGQATAKVEVSQVEPKKLFAIMQSTSSTLPPGEASSISSLSFFFNESGRVFIDVQIRQGNVSYLIDGVKRGFNETEIELPKGQHKVEFRSQTAFPVNNVFNPNVGAFVDIIEDSPSIAPTAVPTNAPSNPNNNSNSSFTTQVNSLITSINAVKTPKNKAQKAIQIALLKQIKENNEEISTLEKPDADPRCCDRLDVCDTQFI